MTKKCLEGGLTELPRPLGGGRVPCLRHGERRRVPPRRPQSARPPITHTNLAQSAQNIHANLFIPSSRAVVFWFEGGGENWFSACCAS